MSKTAACITFGFRKQAVLPARDYSGYSPETAAKFRAADEAHNAQQLAQQGQLDARRAGQDAQLQATNDSVNATIADSRTSQAQMAQQRQQEAAAQYENANLSSESRDVLADAPPTPTPRRATLGELEQQTAQSIGSFTGGPTAMRLSGPAMYTAGQEVPTFQNTQSQNNEYLQNAQQQRRRIESGNVAPLPYTYESRRQAEEYQYTVPGQPGKRSIDPGFVQKYRDSRRPRTPATSATFARKRQAAMNPAGGTRYNNPTVHRTGDVSKAGRSPSMTNGTGAVRQVNAVAAKGVTQNNARNGGGLMGNKTMTASVVSTLSPITEGARNIGAIFPPDLLTVNPSYTDQLVDYVQARDQLEEIKKERKKPFWHNLITGAGTAAAIGAGSGYLKGTLLGANPVGPLAWAGAGTLGALAAGSTAAMLLGRRALRKRLEDRAQKTVDTSDPSVVYAARHPATSDVVHQYAESDWLPYYGTEVGAIGGMLGGLGTSWALGSHGPGKPFPTLSAVGSTLAGAGIGAAVGFWLRNKRKKQMATEIEEQLADARSGLAQEAVTNIEVEKAGEEAPMLKAAKPMARYDNSKLQRNQSVIRYKSGPACAKKAGVDLSAKLTAALDEYKMQIKAAAILTEVREQLEQSSLARTCDVFEDRQVKEAADQLDSVFGKLTTEGGLADALPEKPKPITPSTTDVANQANTTMKEVAANELEGGQPNAGQQNAGASKTVTAAVADPVRAKLPYRKRVEVYALKDGKVYGGVHQDGSFGVFGGGLDDDDLLSAAEREFIEESGFKAKNIRQVPGEMVRVDWNPPYKSDKLAERAKKYRGSETYFTIADFDDSEQQARATGEAGASTLAKRRLYDYDEAIQLLDSAKQIDGFDADELANLRAARRRIIASLKPQAKTADVASLLPRSEAIYFTPAGKLAVRRGTNRRFELPSDIENATPVPYERPIRLVPSAGVPDAKAHGYEVQLSSAEGALPEGYEEVDPQDALKDLYASMGMPSNAEYQALDRARARALLRLLKKRQRVVPPA